MPAETVRRSPVRLRLDSPWRQVMAATALIAAIQIGWFAQTEYQDHARTVARVERDTRNVAHLLAEHAAQTFDTMGETLRAVGRLRADAARGIYRSQASIHVHLRTLHGGSPLLDEIGWFDSYGERVATSQTLDPPRISVAAQELFRVHVDGPTSAVHVSRPTRSTDGVNWLIDFSLRLENLDGSFAGIAHGSLSASKLAETYRALDLGPGHEISLLRRDGVALARTPDDSALLGQMIDHGIASRAAQARAGIHDYRIDSDPLRGAIVGSIATVPRTGDQLVVDVSLSRDAAFADFWRAFWQDATKLAIAVSALFCGGFLLAGSLRRREQLVTELSAATASARAAEAAADRIAKSEADLHRALAAERDMSAQQRRFIAIASHEFRTPLTIIDGAAQRLSRTGQAVSTEEILRRVGRIRGAVSRMTEIIERTLSSARMDEGRIEYHPRDIDLVRLVRDACAQRRHLSPDFTISLRAPDAPLHVQGDPVLLDQVLANLLSNAIKYSGPSRRVEVDLGADARGARVSVRDFGIGIPAVDLPKLFTRFYRASNAATIAGVGIGLNLVRELATLHGGTIEVESSAGRGTVFTLAIPEIRPERVEKTHHAEAASASA